MGSGAQLSVIDQRRSIRHPVDFAVIGGHRDTGDMAMHICNVSPHGFMIDDADGLARGDRVLVHLPLLGRIEAHCIWTKDHRAGLQFERLIRPDEFAAMLGKMQPNPALRSRS